jgi:hypothetical protein
MAVLLLLFQKKKKIGNAWFVAMHCGIDFLRLLPWFQVFIEVVVALVS